MKAYKASFVAAGLLAAFALVVIGFIFCSAFQASSFNPDPEHRFASDDAMEPKDDLFPAVDWDYWQDVNPDVIGWVTVPGTEIDYPIVQGHSSSPTHYLHYNVYNRWDYHGVPYLTWECQEGGLLESGNALVFGHHLQDGTMFSKLARFIDPDYVDAHSPILVQTPSARAKLNVVAVDRVNANIETTRINFEEGLDHAMWLADRASCSDLDLSSEGYDFGSADHVVTFCTCSYSTWVNERTLVYCVVENMID